MGKGICSGVRGRRGREFSLYFRERRMGASGVNEGEKLFWNFFRI